MKHVVYIALGSNLGDRLENLKISLSAMEPEIDPIVCSPIYETPPWGYLDQPFFLNQVIRAETELSPEDLLTRLKKIEVLVGRQETFRYGPRIIDLDILFYDAEVLDSPPLKIPHPRVQERAFVLLPLAKLAPEFRHPVLGQTVEEMLAQTDVEQIEWYSAGGCGQETG